MTREQSQFVRRVRLLFEKQNLLHAGDRVGVAVSGGADSVALLVLLVELRAALGIVPFVVHFNHGLRGKASDGDEKFVAKLAARHGLEFFAGRENVGAKAKRERANLEDAARRARYGFFERVAKEQQFARIAVAHTAEDQAETVLAHILRGAGLAGLAGIHPEAGCVFRPLLTVRRKELREYLRARRQAWREDKTNRDETRTRSRIRYQLLPFLEKKFNPAVVEHVCRLAELAREDDAYLDRLAALRMEAIAKETRDGVAIPIRKLVADKKQIPHPLKARVRDDKSQLAGADDSGREANNGALARRVIRELVKRVKARTGELGTQHVDEVLRLAQEGEPGKLLQLPGGVEVRRERNALVFRAAGARTEKAANAFSVGVEIPAKGEALRIAAHSHILHLRVIDWPPEGRETNKTGAVLDCDRLRFPLVVRNWQPGDAMLAAGHKNRHTLGRLLNEAGVSRWAKESWPVLTSAGSVAWALGLPAAKEFAVREGSRTALVIIEETST